MLTLPQSGPDGAVSGSLWACRETFVAIIVTNLPIIHPLFRQLAKAIGLGALLSIQSKSRSQSYPLQDGAGIEQRRNTTRKSHPHPLSIPNDFAWASDEHILPTDNPGRSSGKDGGGIVVAHEVSVRSDAAEGRESGTTSEHVRKDEWALKNMAFAEHNVAHDRV
jgi:hypothetical protein